MEEYKTSKEVMYTWDDVRYLSLSKVL